MERILALPQRCNSSRPAEFEVYREGLGGTPPVSLEYTRRGMSTVAMDGKQTGASGARRPATEASRSVDFYALLRPVQQRFLMATAGEGAPVPVLFAPRRRGTGLVWLVGALACLAALYHLGTTGFGDLHHPLALQGVTFIAAYAALWGGATFLSSTFAGVRATSFSTPFPAGVYVFPVGIIDARSATIRIIGLSEVKKAEKVDGKFVFTTIGGRFSFPASSESTQETMDAWLEENRAKLEKAQAGADARTLAMMDPLLDSGVSNPLLPETQLRPPPRRWPVRAAMALLIGLSFGYATFILRGKLAEKKLYEAAQRENTVEAYEAYLARGGKAPDVEPVLLPRAQLERIQGDLGALEAYASEHKSSRIQKDVDAALRRALLARLDEVTRGGTLDALVEFRKERKHTHLIRKELAEARGKMFDTVFKEFEKIADPGALEFFDVLLGYVEAHGPRVEVRFRRFLPELSVAIETAIRASAYFGGNKSLPRQYFDEENARRREEKAASILLPGLQAGFKKDYLEFVLGEPLEGDGDWPEVKVPTLFVQHTTNMSGGFTNQVPRGVYVGLGQEFIAKFVVPGQETTFDFTRSFWVPPNLTILREQQLDTGPFYDVMATPGYERFARNLLEKIYKGPPQP